MLAIHVAARIARSCRGLPRGYRSGLSWSRFFLDGVCELG